MFGLIWCFVALGFDDFARVGKNGGFQIYDFFKLNFLFFLCLFLKKISEFMGLLEFGLLAGEEHEVHVLGKEEHDVLTKKLTKSNKKN